MPDPLAGKGPPWCDLPCPGHPSASAFTGITHVHHHCWSCDQEILSRGESTYICDSCEVTAGPACVSHTYPTYDPDFAATSPSPG